MDNQTMSDDFGALLEIDDDFEALLHLQPVSALDLPIPITRFPDTNAKVKAQLNLSLRQFMDVVTATTANRKSSLPLFKLAMFGEQPSSEGCLRHDANVLAVGGLEGDYDGGQISLADAERRLRQFGIAGMLYTTPSHREASPRWRVLLPFSKSYEPTARSRFMARLSAVFDNTLDPASFTLSQSYYGGCLTGQPKLTVKLVDGRPIDLLNELDSLAAPEPDQSEIDSHANCELRPMGFSIEEIRDVLDCLSDEQWQGYHGAWFDIGAALHHETDGSEIGYELFLEYSKRKPGWKPGCLTRKKWASFGKTRRHRITFRTLLRMTKEERRRRSDDYFIDVFCDDLPEKPSAKDPVVARLNNRHAVVVVRGRTLVTTERSDGSVDFGTVRDIHAYYENEQVSIGKGKTEPASRRWMRDPERRTFAEGVTFAPGGCEIGTLNLWRGWAVEPEADASCELFLHHVRQVVCRGVPEHADYVIGWLAHMVQRPDEKPGVGLVLKGAKGAGKDTVADYVARMIGRRHAPTVAESDHIVGKFNARLENALMLHVQEGSWAGDRKAEGVLKYLVTSDRIEIERKGIDSINLPSVLRLFISANADWVVPASPDERRWAVFEVSDMRKGDATYFSALRVEMQGKGPAALLHYLQSYDLRGFNVRAAPDTEGLRNQKLASLRGLEAWWMEMLERGAMHTGSMDDADWIDTPQTVERDGLRNRYIEWLRSRRYDGDPIDARLFGRKLREMLPTLEDKRPRIDGVRVWQYLLPVLAECREAFAAWLGSDVDWDNTA